MPSTIAGRAGLYRRAHDIISPIHMSAGFLARVRCLRFRSVSTAGIVLVASLWVSAPPRMLCAAQAEAVADADTAVILYDSLPDPHAGPYVHALFLENLLTHFDLRADLIPLTEYRRGQLRGYRAGFLIGVHTRHEDSACCARRHSGDQANRLPGWVDISNSFSPPQKRAASYGFSFVEYRQDLDYRNVSYKQTLLPKPEPDLNIVSITDPKVAEVVATAVNQKKVSSPYVVKSGSFWYFADRPFSYMAEGTRYLVICDLLHDILGIDHPTEQRALVRIEDVSVDDDPDDLVKIADLLADRHIPFQIAIIPIFRDPAHSLEIRLGDRKSTVAAIHYMIAHGGTPVMHGITHQVHGLSGDEYEFWDELGDRPVSGDSAEFRAAAIAAGTIASVSPTASIRSRSRCPITGRPKPTTARSGKSSPCSMTVPWSCPTTQPHRSCPTPSWTGTAGTSYRKTWDIFRRTIPTRSGCSNTPAACG